MRWARGRKALACLRFGWLIRTFTVEKNSSVSGRPLRLAYGAFTIVKNPGSAPTEVGLP